jgi:signal transduction histidine kinase
VAKGRDIARAPFVRQRLTGRPWSWITGRPQLADAVVVAVSLLAGVASVVGTGMEPALILPLLAVVVLESTTLWWRRSHPTAVLLVCVALIPILVLVAPDRDPSSLALIFAVYAASVYAAPRVRLATLVAAFLVVLIGVLLLLTSEFDAARKLMPGGAASLVAWVAGDYMRSRRAFLADLVARNRLEREQAAEQERLRIARELHDVVAHNVSVIAIQAGAARVSGNSSHEALKAIETSARDTLSELNRLVGVLRRGPSGPELTPQPGLAQVETLVRPLRDAGVDLTLKITGERRDLPAALDLSAFRIVQEALTNVLKHARASRAEVTIDYSTDAVTVAVTDNGSGATAPVGASTGHGLIGMRERVDLFGGELTTGSSALGGFTVRARLPIE